MPETPANGLAHCSLEGRDIGEWLVAQGRARANGADYADAEKTAQKEKRGVWSPVRLHPSVGVHQVASVPSHWLPEVSGVT
jgi:endonuclease YncB( thermonuclease family)